MKEKRFLDLKFILPLITLISVAGSPLVYGIDREGALFYKNAKRTVSLIVDDSGYYPETIVTFANEEVQFFMTTTSQSPKCFMVEGQEFFLSASRGRISEGKTVFKNPGQYQFYCPTFGSKGKIVVLGVRPEDQMERTPGSEKNRLEDEWVPREF